MNVPRSLLALVVAAASLTLAAGTGAAAITPAWSLVGNYSLPLDPGFASVAGSYTFPLGEGTSTLTLNYDEKARVSGGGVAANFTVYTLKGSFAVDEDGNQHLHLADPAKKPAFVFDGIVTAPLGDVVGTFTKSDGYLDFPGVESGPLTLTRTGVVPQTRFTLALTTRMDAKGRVRGSLAQDGTSDTRAKLTIYGGRVFEDGRISGKVRSDSTGYTTADVTIAGRGWKVRLTGPVEAGGFHASCDLKVAGFVVKDAELLLSVLPGPPPPVGPPPKPPKNLVPTTGEATVMAGQVTITHSDVPSRFFGAPAGISVEFPYADGLSTVAADSTDATFAPVRRCIVSVGGRTYGTASAAPGRGVSIQIRKLTTIQGAMVEVLLTGKVYPVPGQPKTVNVLLQAIVH